MTWRILAVLVVATVAFAAVPAVAHDHAYDTKITIRETQDGVDYKGHVRSNLHACEARRGIEFWRRHAGPDELIAEFESTAEGKWHYGFIGEHYYVIAQREVVGGAGHRHVCREDKSPTA